MPNWSNTTMEFKGNKSVLEKIETAVRENNLSCLGLEEPLDNPKWENYVNENGEPCTGLWHEWHIQYWGTKWEMEISNIENIDGILTISGQCAWNGPNKWFKYISQKFKLSSTYTDWETGADFFEVIEYKKGELIKEATVELLSKEAYTYIATDAFSGYEYVLYESKNLEDASQKFPEVFNKAKLMGISNKEVENILFEVGAEYGEEEQVS